MNSQEIQAIIDVIPEWKSDARATPRPLWEIALQLARRNELTEKRHEENLRQRDEFLMDPLSERIKASLGLADPEPGKTDPVGERGTMRKIGVADACIHCGAHRRSISWQEQCPALVAHQKPELGKAIAAALRSCAQTILENQMKPTHASDYLNSYADAVQSHEARREDAVSERSNGWGLFHRLWTKAVMNESYVKAEWMELERMLPKWFRPDRPVPAASTNPPEDSPHPQAVAPAPESGSKPQEPEDWERVRDELRARNLMARTDKEQSSVPRPGWSGRADDSPRSEEQS